MTDKEKLTALMEKFAGGNQQMFAQLIGVPRSNVATWMHRGSITANGREAILDAFPQVSRDWLLEGSATSYSRTSSTSASLGIDDMMHAPEVIHFSRKDLIPLFEDCRASCGVLEQFEHPELATDHIHVPGMRAKAALPAEGISMEPTIHEGDICLVGDEVPLTETNQRSIYLIVTRQGHCMFKRIFDEGVASERVLALSENPAYSPQAEALLKSDVLHLYPLKYVLHKIE